MKVLWAFKNTLSTNISHNLPICVVTGGACVVRGGASVPANVQKYSVKKELNNDFRSKTVVVHDVQRDLDTPHLLKLN